MLKSLNPNHSAVREAEGQWHKIAALLLLHFGKRQVKISLGEIERVAGDKKGVNIAVQFDDERGIILTIMDDATAQAVAEREGGLSV